MAEEDAKITMDPQNFLEKFYPGGFYGYDREGRPVFWEPLGQVDFWGILHSVRADEVMKYKRKHCEMAKTLCEVQEKKLEKKLGQLSLLVLDAYGGGRKHLWRPGLDLFKSLVGMYDDEYPNLRKHILVIRAPAIFPILYSLLTPFLKHETKAKIKVLGSDWQEKLKKYIDPEQIPIYYGGNAKDESGNEKCEASICYGGEIPHEYYINENVKQSEFQTTIIKAGRKLTVDCDVTVPNTIIKYQYVTSDYDILFFVYLENGSKEEREYIVEKSRKQSHIMMEDGEITCEKVGKYVFAFDNRYSWIRDKQLFYLIKSDNSDDVPLVENEAESDVTKEMAELDMKD